MTKPLKLLDTQTIRSECSASSFQRGKLYFNEKRVTFFQIDKELTNSVAISARVKGSHATPYKQLLTIEWFHDFQDAEIEGRCSCPMGYNCKHVAAVCLEYQKYLLAQSSAATDTACFDWLESMEADTSDSIAPNSEFLVYLLKPGSAKQEISVEICITKFKKNGSLNKGRMAQLNSLNQYSFRTPHYLTPQDQEIIKLLSSMPNSYLSAPQLKGMGGGLALGNMLNTGRLYWQNLEKPALQAGDSRELTCLWQADNLGDFHLLLKIKPEAQLIQTDPPYYMDSQTGQLGPVNTLHLNSQQLQKLANAPIVPAQFADQFSQRLILEYPHLNLPTPKKVEITELDQLEVKPRLSLLGHAEDNGSWSHQLKLTFDYGSYTLSARHYETHTSLLTEQGYLRIRRHSEFENACIERIAAAGFQTLNDPHDLLFNDTADNVLVKAQHWHGFLTAFLPQLQADGWQVEIDPSFQLNFQSINHWEADITENQQDWFEMSFNIEINGQSLPLLPLLTPVLTYYSLDDLPEVLTIPLSAHDYLTLPGAKLRPFLAILYEVFGTLNFNDTGIIKLSRFEAAGLAELESHSYGIFSLKGGEALRELGRKLIDFNGIAHVALPDNLQAELRHYQHQGLNWLQFLREYQFGGILADDMGLGKTLQTLTHLLVEKHSGRMTAPCLIIAPTSLMSNWHREAKRFTPDLKVLVLQGTERKQLFDQINDYDIVLTTYPLLPRDEAFLLAQDYYYLILDEAQIVKNPSAKAAKIARAVKTQHRLCLTGTPMENHLGELWTQFDFLMPGFLGDNADFKRRYRSPIEMHGDGEQRQRLSKRVAPFMLRRSKQDVVTELPAKTEIIRAVPLGQKQAMLYESIRLTMECKVQQAIAEKGLARSHITILDALLKLRQTCCDPRTLPLQEAKKVKESAKLELLMEMLPEMLEEGRRILVFSQFTRMIVLIETELDNRKILYSKLTGQTRQRDEAIERFKSGVANVFLISLKAGGVGLNLTEADTVIVYDPWWNPAAETQAADRAYRIGQDKPVFVYKLITENTVEEKILVMQDKKRALANGIYNGGQKEEALRLTAEDLTALFEPLKAIGS